MRLGVRSWTEAEAQRVVLKYLTQGQNQIAVVAGLSKLIHQKNIFL
jgi:hypothetical protein